MNLQPNNWLKQIQQLGENHPYAMGSVERLKEYATSVKKRWVKGLTAAKIFYSN